MRHLLILPFTTALAVSAFGHPPDAPPNVRAYHDEMLPYEYLYAAGENLQRGDATDADFYIEKARSKQLTAMGIAAFVGLDSHGGTGEEADGPGISRYIPGLLEFLTNRYQHETEYTAPVDKNDELYTLYRLAKKFHPSLEEELDFLLFRNGICRVIETIEMKIERKKYKALIDKLTRLSIRPSFPGDLKSHIRAWCHYPHQAEKEKAEGTVVVSFIVDIDGSLRDIRVVQGVHPMLDVVALKAVSVMGKWIPCEYQGEKVPMTYKLPITFKLPATSNE